MPGTDATSASSTTASPAVVGIAKCPEPPIVSGTVGHPTGTSSTDSSSSRT
ncbi:MAG: hypothetical protein R3F61_37620 [Myxococcota bacterium]